MSMMMGHMVNGSMLQRRNELRFSAGSTADQLMKSYDTGLNSSVPVERQNAMLDLELHDLREHHVPVPDDVVSSLKGPHLHIHCHMLPCFHCRQWTGARHTWHFVRGAP